VGENRDFMNKIILLILVCFILTIPTKAYSITGSKWLESCTQKAIGNTPPWAKLTCVSYLRGLNDMKYEMRTTYNYIFKLLKQKYPSETYKTIHKHIEGMHNIEKLCVPKEVGTKQLVKVMIKFFDKYPERLHEQMSSSFISGMIEYFPCPSK